MAPNKEHKEPPEHRTRRMNDERYLQAAFGDVDDILRQFKLLCKAALCLDKCDEMSLSHEVMCVVDKRKGRIIEVLERSMKRSQRGDR